MTCSMTNGSVDIDGSPVRHARCLRTGAAEGCKQAIRFGARSLEHAYLIAPEGIEMAERAGSYIVPTVQMTQEDLHQLHAARLPCQAVRKFHRDNELIFVSQKLLTGRNVNLASGT